MNELIIFAVANMGSDADQNFMADLYVNYRGLMKMKALEYVETNYDAEDIVSEASIKLMRKIPLLKALECPALVSYVVLTIETTSLNFINQRNKESDSMFLYGDDDIINDMIQDMPDMEMPEKIYIEKDGAKKIREMLDRLQPKYRLMLQCRYFQDMSNDEIAEIFKIKPASVRKYITRAKVVLRKIIEKEHDFNGIK